MKVLIVTPHFYPENFRINDFADALVERNINVSVFTAIPDYPEGKYYEGYGLFTKRREIRNKVRIFRAPIIPRGNGSNMQLFLNYVSFIIFGSISGIFIKEKFDIIFVFEPSPITVGIPAIVIKKIKKIPIVFWVLDLWPESVKAAGNLGSDIIPQLILPLIKFIYRESDKILVSSRGFIKSIKEKGVGLNKIEYFPQWAESSFKPVKKINPNYKILVPDGFNIMFAGNIGEAQDFASILKAAELLQKNNGIHFVILGSGSKANWVKNKVYEKGLTNTVHLLGTFPLAAMPDFYAIADIMLITLKNDYIFSLTVPAKIQSYLACGKPIVAMMNGEGARVVTESKAGLSCNSGDFRSLAENILKLYELEEAMLLQMGKNAENYYHRNFSRHTLIDQAINIFTSLIKKTNVNSQCDKNHIDG